MERRHLQRNFYKTIKLEASLPKLEFSLSFLFFSFLFFDQQKRRKTFLYITWIKCEEGNCHDTLHDFYDTRILPISSLFLFKLSLSWMSYSWLRIIEVSLDGKSEYFLRTPRKKKVSFCNYRESISLVCLVDRKCSWKEQDTRMCK